MTGRSWQRVFWWVSFGLLCLGPVATAGCTCGKQGEPGAEVAKGPAVSAPEKAAVTPPPQIKAAEPTSHPAPDPDKHVNGRRPPRPMPGAVAAPSSGGEAGGQ